MVILTNYRGKIDFWVPLSLFRSGHQAAAHGVTDTQQFASLCTMASSGIQALGFRQISQKIP
jgi:hypothetical protein